MAKIWMVQGSTQHGGPYAELPWLECRDLLELDGHSRTEDRPKFGDKSTWPISSTVVVQVEEEEAHEVGIKPGFFVSPVTVHQAQKLLDKRRSNTQE